MNTETETKQAQSMASTVGTKDIQKRKSKFDDIEWMRAEFAAMLKELEEASEKETSKGQ